VQTTGRENRQANLRPHEREIVAGEHSSSVHNHGIQIVHAIGAHPLIIDVLSHAEAFRILKRVAVLALASLVIIVLNAV
jgi:hypothetical protein